MRVTHHTYMTTPAAAVHFVVTGRFPGVRGCTHVQATHAVRRPLATCIPERMPPSIATLTYMTYTHTYTCLCAHARDDTGCGDQFCSRHSAAAAFLQCGPAAAIRLLPAGLGDSDRLSKPCPQLLAQAPSPPTGLRTETAEGCSEERKNKRSLSKSRCALGAHRPPYTPAF